MKIDVVVIGLSGAFLHATMEEENEVIMVREGWLAELMAMSKQRFTRNV